MLKRIIYITILLAGWQSLHAQNPTPEQSNQLPFTLESQNFLKYNRNFLNPTFSLVRENSTFISPLTRNESLDFSDNTNTLLLNYSGKSGENTGIGIGLFQQNRGILSFYGATANYAYGFSLGEKAKLSFGANLSYYRSDIRTSDIIGDQTDPNLFNRDQQSILSFQPGINLTVGAFDIGVYAENLVDYDFKSSEMLTDFADKTFSGHIMYTTGLSKDAVGMFENAQLRLMARGRRQPTFQDDASDVDYQLSGNIILDLPKIGWIQSGYDQFYGAHAGIGLNLSKNISIGYNIEKAFNGDRSNLGATHEFGLAYRFNPSTDNGELAEEEEDPEEEQPVLATSAREMQELKDNVAINMQLLEDFMARQDSINRANDGRFNRLMTMLAQMQNNRPRDGRDGRDGNDGNNGTSTTNDRIITNADKDRNNRIKDNTNVGTPKTNTRTVSASKPKSNKRKGAVVINGVDEGFYLIANVYKGKDNKYFNKFFNELKEKGLDPGYFVNPKNGMKYVYLRKHNKRSDAIRSYKSNLDNSYQNELWVMDVVNDTDVRVAQKSGPKYQFDAVANNDNTVKKNDLAKKDGSSSIIGKEKSGKDVINKSDAYTSTSSPRKKIAKPKVLNAKGVDGGFYIVANVYSKKLYADRFIKKLKSEGIDAGYFINPKNNFRYVYLKKHQSWNNALTSYYSNVDETYFDNIWIMRVNTISL
ncbi:PorP/SprF family type IX secretion system membrane protein [Spongiivirga citrea]|uniref:Type IX secretion system membrane protein PorP/SprF n=1 Tax=Spongiivirga citrea TaxID=1481457 RepID=A0A6M0CUJ0_9FLAO|nr:PorP/SprF family type IX secretion system membrane protein [Spongiivirga citrea]NER17430.1 type IX secretion system membrane protein PorP/SprF [Spongiivirga citrea]